MLYPVYVHLGDERHAYGVTIPDFPGCFSAADSAEDLPTNIQEAAELHFEGEDLDIPKPTPLNELANQPEYEGGVWMMVDIDLARIRPKAVRLNVSLPDSLVRRIDEYAKTHHMSRSGFLAKAAEEAMRE
jgi:predicted RNase H-like HicB family nuclease